MRACLGTLLLPGGRPATLDAANAVTRTLWAQHHIEVPSFAFAGRLWIRISAQIYTDISQYERLATAVLALPPSPR
jgi:isopenicillin-N epimerase